MEAECFCFCNSLIFVIIKYFFFVCFFLSSLNLKTFSLSILRRFFARVTINDFRLPITDFFKMYSKFFCFFPSSACYTSYGPIVYFEFIILVGCLLSCCSGSHSPGYVSLIYRTLPLLRSWRSLSSGSYSRGSRAFGVVGLSFR